MRSSLCIFLISLLLAQTFGASVHNKVKAQDLQFFETIRRTDFGKTLLQSLQLTTRTHSSNALDSVLSILTQMLANENDAQVQADTAWETESAECEAFAVELQQEIDDASAQIVQNNNDIELLNSAIADAQASLDEANDKLVTSTNALENLVEQRETEHNTFLQNIADISATITALHQGRDILAELQATGVTEEAAEEEEAFIQKNHRKPTVFSQFTSHVSSFNLKKSTKYHGFVTALLTMLSRQEVVADQALVTQVINLIDSLVEQLSTELTTLSANENDAQLIFQTQSTYLSSDISALNSEIAAFQADITDKNAQVSDLTSFNSNLEVNIENKTQELTDSQQTCSDDQTAYENLTEQRAGEIDIINQVINIFQTRFDSVQSYLTEESF